MYDVAIIGAGPIGTYLSTLCKNMKVLVLEEHNQAGNKACSGLVSPRIKGFLPKKVLNSKGLFSHELKGAVVHIANATLEFRKKETAAYVIDRDLLDKKMAEYAESCGVIIKYNERATKLTVTGKNCTVKTSKNSYDSDVIAGCEGANSITSRHIGCKPSEVLSGIMVIVDKESYSDRTEIWADKEKAKDGFLWKMPRGREIEYGALGKNIDFKTVEKFFKIDTKKIKKRLAAPIPIGIVKTYSNRILTVGDSACQTKPWSGGGIIFGMTCAKVASDVIRKCLTKNDFSEPVLSEYDTRWKEILVKEIQGGLAFRELYKDLKEIELSKMIENFKSVGSFGEKTDFDFPISSSLGRWL